MKWRLAKRLSALSPSATDQASIIAKELVSKGIDVISLCDGEPKFDTPRNIKEAARRALKAGKTKYGPTGGIQALRELICEKLARENHITTGVQDVVVTPGAKFLVFLTFLTVLNEGDRVVLLDPCTSAVSATGPDAKLGKLLGQVEWKVFPALAWIQALLPGCNHRLRKLNHVQSIKASLYRQDGMIGDLKGKDDCGDQRTRFWK